jgi:hypothetical protein
MSVDNSENKWRYERGEGRRKHLWDKDYAGFQPSRRGDLPGRKNLSRQVLRKLCQNADRKGEIKELERWLKKYGGPAY